MPARKLSALSHGSKPLRGWRVLAAEDSWHLVSAMKNLLESEGAIVVGPASAPGEAEHLADTALIEALAVDRQARTAAS